MAGLIGNLIFPDPANRSGCVVGIEQVEFHYQREQLAENAPTGDWPTCATRSS